MLPKKESVLLALLLALAALRRLLVGTGSVVKAHISRLRFLLVSGWNSPRLPTVTYGEIDKLTHFSLISLTNHSDPWNKIGRNIMRSSYEQHKGKSSTKSRASSG